MSKLQNYVAELRKQDKTIIGYFVSDDRDVERDSSKGKTFIGRDAAKLVCEKLNSEWNLSDGEKFYPRNCGVAKRYRNVQKPQLTRL